MSNLCSAHSAPNCVAIGKAMKFTLQTMSGLRYLFFGLTFSQRVTLKSIVESHPVDLGNRSPESLIELGLVEWSTNGLLATEAGRYVAKLY